MIQPRYILPAEWEKQSCVQLTWPHQNTDWGPYLTEATDAFASLTSAIARHERLIVATPQPDETRGLLKERLANEELQNVAIYKCESNDTWARDHGAITLVDRTHTASNRLLDFRFNGWGRKFAADKDNAITQTLYKQGAFEGELIDNNDFVLEGGSIESDGMGTIMTTTFCLLAPNRNQPMAKAELERELLKRLCARRIIWLDHGKLIGDDTDGHIDTIARFAPDDTIIYVGCDDKKDPQYDDFALFEMQLQRLRTLGGEPYRLVRLPMPEPMYDGIDRLPATYANFFVVNGAVIVPTYRQPTLDRKAQSLIGHAFPGREVIGIDSSTIIRQHGSIHCLTMQYY